MTLLTAANWPIVGQIAIVLGKVMSLIYNTLDSVLPTDHGLVGWSIILYTIIVYTLMLPITIKQQKTTKLTAVINPEVQEIQKKYKNKKDQASMMKQQEEIQQVYDKYGTSMTGGCLPLLIQMPLLFALYPVIYNMERYVPAIKNATEDVQRFFTIPNMSMSPSQIMHDRNSFGISVAAIVITCIALPIISALTQYISIKISQSFTNAPKKDKKEENPMESTMKTMNVTMPLFSLFMVYTLSAGIGLYWIVSAIVRCVQMVLINKHLEKVSLDEMIEKNKEKAAKKREKRGEKAAKINEMAQSNTKKLSSSAKKNTVNANVKEEKLQKAETARNNAKSGSLSSRANMVKNFNDSKK